MARRVLLLLFAIAALTVSACGGDDTDPRVRAVEDGEATLIDVRTQGEWNGGHARDAIHLPLDDVKDGVRPDVAKERPILVYCRTGRRAAEAMEILERDGFTDVRNVGGLKDWERAGGRLVPR